MSERRCRKVGNNFATPYGGHVSQKNLIYFGSHQTLVYLICYAQKRSPELLRLRITNAYVSVGQTDQPFAKFVSTNFVTAIH